MARAEGAAGRITPPGEDVELALGQFNPLLILPIILLTAALMALCAIVLVVLSAPSAGISSGWWVVDYGRGYLGTVIAHVSRMLP